MSFLSRADDSLLGQWWWTIDRQLLFTIFSIMGLGVILVATASPPVATRIGLDQYHFLLRHFILLVPAIVIMLAVSLLNLRYIWRLSSIIFAASIFLLIYVLLFGMEIKGAQRWIHLPGFSLQPSEFIKPAFIVVTAWLIALRKEKENFPVMKIIAGLYAFVAFLLLSQPDLGMTFVVTACLMSVVFLAGLPLRIVAVLMGTGILALVIVYLTFPHVQSRIDRFVNPEIGDTYQMDQSLNAFRAGGVFGAGPGQGEVKLSLPDAHADFVFSVAGEELGLILTTLIVLLYLYVLYRGFNILYERDNLFVILATGGLLTMFGLQAFIHMGSALQLLPAKGMTLPFLSYGGSSLLSMSLSMGMVLGLTRKHSDQTIVKRSAYIKKVDKAVI
ncbi:MAG: putative lipid II flippase FtsW [Pseudomonadota bacterium]